MASDGPILGAECKSQECYRWAEGIDPDDRDPRTLGLGPCGYKHTPEKKYRQNPPFCAWLWCRTCSLRLHYVPKEGAPAARKSLGPTPSVVTRVLERLEEEGGPVTGNRVRGMIKEEQGKMIARWGILLRRYKTRLFFQKLWTEIELVNMDRDL